jgi:hypothetical protein
MIKIYLFIVTRSAAIANKQAIVLSVPRLGCMAKRTAPTTVLPPGLLGGILFSTKETY